MKRFNKVCYFKIILLVANILFLINTTAYSLTLPGKTHLRIPLQDYRRFKQVLKEQIVDDKNISRDIRPFSAFRLSEETEEKALSLKQDLVLFKIGDQNTINRYAGRLVELVHKEIPDFNPDEWVILQHVQRNIPLLHSRGLLIKEIAGRLGISRQVNIIAGTEFANYSALSDVKERENIWVGQFELTNPDEIKEKKVLIFDDVWVTGALQRALIKAIQEKVEIADIKSFVMIDATGATEYEFGAYESLILHAIGRLREILWETKGFSITQTAMKYLMRYALESPDEFMAMILDPEIYEGKTLSEVDAQILAKNRELLINLLRIGNAYLAIRHEEDTLNPVPYLKGLLAALWRIERHSPVPNEMLAELPEALFLPSMKAEHLQLLEEFKQKWSGEKVKPSGKTKALIIDSGQHEWQSEVSYTAMEYWPTPCAPVLFAYLAGNHYLVFSDRRKISPEDTREALQAARILRVSVGSPYETPLPREIYAPEEAEDQSRLLTEIPELKSLKGRVSKIRRETKSEILELYAKGEVDSEGYLIIAAEYSEHIKDVFRDLCPVVLKKTQVDSGMPFVKEDISVVLGGSTARRSATVESDIELEFIAKNPSMAEYVTNHFGPLLAQCLRTIGIEVTPSDDLFKQQLERRRLLKVYTLFDPLSDKRTHVESMIRVFDYEFVWGSQELFDGFLEKSLVDIKNHDRALQETRLVTDEFLEISRKGEGVFTERNFFIFKDGDLIFNAKGLYQVFLLGLREALIEKIFRNATEGVNSVQDVPRSIAKLVSFMNDRGFFDYRMSQDEIEKIKSAWERAEAARQIKIALAGRNGSISLEKLPKTFLGDTEILWQFIQQHIIANRNFKVAEVFFIITDAIESNEIISMDSILDKLSGTDLEELYENLIKYEQGSTKALYRARASAYAYAVAQLRREKKDSQEAIGRLFTHIRDLTKEIMVAQQEGIEEKNLRIPDYLQGGKWLTVKSPVRIEIESQGASDLLTISIIKPELSQAQNLSIDLEGHPPVQVAIRKIESPVIKLRSKDLGITEDIESLEELLEGLSGPEKDPLCLLKTAIVVSGVIPVNLIEKNHGSLKAYLSRLGGGFEIVTEVRGITQHSGLGVSGILGGSAVLALRKFSGQGASGMEITKEELEKVVGLGIFIEQLIGTGGGYQDFFGLVPGLKDIQAQPENNILHGITREGITPKFKLVELKPVVLDRIKAGMVLWDQGANIPVKESLHAIVIGFLLGRDRELREEWQDLYYDIKEAFKKGDLKRVGQLKSRSFELRHAICRASWPEFADLYASRVEEELRKYFGSDYYGSDMSGSRPGAARIEFINPERREEFERIAPSIAKSIQEEIFRKASEQGWTDVNFGEPKIYSFSINTQGANVSIVEEGVDLDSLSAARVCQ